MDFHAVSDDLSTHAMSAVAFALGLDVSPNTKRVLLVSLFTMLGNEFYQQMYTANSEVFDSASITSSYTLDEDRLQRLAWKLVRQYVLGRVVSAIVKEYFDCILADAEHEAFRNAVSLEKHPTLTRSVVSETCAWCQNLAGTHVNPEPIHFARHDNCDCQIVVSGYNTRNGVLKNYKKKKGGSE